MNNQIPECNKSSRRSIIKQQFASPPRSGVSSGGLTARLQRSASSPLAARAAEERLQKAADESGTKKKGGRAMPNIGTRFAYSAILLSIGVPADRWPTGRRIKERRGLKWLADESDNVLWTVRTITHAEELVLWSEHRYREESSIRLPPRLRVTCYTRRSKVERAVMKYSRNRGGWRWNVRGGSIRRRQIKCSSPSEARRLDSRPPARRPFESRVAPPPSADTDVDPISGSMPSEAISRGAKEDGF